MSIKLRKGKNKMSNYKSREFYEKMFIAYIDECGLDLPKGQMSAIVRDTVWKY